MVLIAYDAAPCTFTCSFTPDAHLLAVHPGEIKSSQAEESPQPQQAQFQLRRQQSPPPQQQMEPQRPLQEAPKRRLPQWQQQQQLQQLELQLRQREKNLTTHLQDLAVSKPHTGQPSQQGRVRRLDSLQPSRVELQSQVSASAQLSKGRRQGNRSAHQALQTSTPSTSQTLPPDTARGTVMYITPSATLQSTSEIPAQSEALLSLPKSDAIPQGQLRDRRSNHRRSRNSDSGLSAARTVPAESSSHAGNADELTTKPLHIVTRSALPPVVRRPMRSLTPGSTPQQPASSVKQQQNTRANQCMKPAVSSAKHEKVLIQSSVHT
jgi:hypothetical protein